MKPIEVRSATSFWENNKALFIILYTAFSSWTYRTGLPLAFGVTYLQYNLGATFTSNFAKMPMRRIRTYSRLSDRRKAPEIWHFTTSHRSWAKHSTLDKNCPRGDGGGSSFLLCHMLTLNTAVGKSTSFNFARTCSVKNIREVSAFCCLSWVRVCASRGQKQSIIWSCVSSFIAATLLQWVNCLRPAFKPYCFVVSRPVWLRAKDVAVCTIT